MTSEAEATQKATCAVLSELTPVGINGKEGTRLAIVLRTRGCSYARGPHGGCTYCAFLHNSDASVAAQALQRQLANELGKYPDGSYDHVELLTLGSFLDADEVPVSFQNSALARLGNNPSVLRLMVESRPEYVSSETLGRAMRHLGDRCLLEIGIGLESADDYVREVRLNKGFSREEFEAAAEVITECGAGLLGYVLFKPPGLSEAEAIRDAIATGEYIFSLGKRLGIPTRVALEPFYVPRNTLAEAQYKSGDYSPPWLWSVIEVVSALANKGDVFVGLNSEGLADNEGVSANCDACSGFVRQSLVRFNGDQMISGLRALSCECRGKWQVALATRNRVGR